MQNQGTVHYGLSVLIWKDETENGKNIYYLLGHLSELFHTVKIDDKGQLYTSNYGIFDIFENIEKKYKTNALLQLLYSFDNKELVESIRYGTVQKPLEFDKEKKNDEFVKALRNAGFTAIEDEKKDYWSNIKEQAGKLFNRENCFWFYHPVTFMDALDSMGILNIHAKELRRVQDRILRMNTLQENGPGIFDQGGYTFCNHAAFLTIRAVDADYLKFTDNYDAPIDSFYPKYDKNYQYKESSYWCVVLKKQVDAKIISELTTCQDIISYANIGYVVIVAWENPSAGAPHYATVRPCNNCKDIKDIKLCNVYLQRKIPVNSLCQMLSV